jgi:hypothetical protein
MFEMSRVFSQKSFVRGYLWKPQEEDGIGSNKEMTLTSEHWP